MSSTATSLLAGGALLAGVNSVVGKKERFEDTTSTLLAIILILIIIGLYVALLVAVYRLTNRSWAHVILCFLLGSLYLMVVMIYYGFTGHHFAKIK